VEGKAQLLRHGSSAAIIRGAGDAINEQDYDFASRCYNAYLLKTSQPETDGYKQTIAEMLTNTPVLQESEPSAPNPRSTTQTAKPRSGATRTKKAANDRPASMEKTFEEPSTVLEGRKRAKLVGILIKELKALRPQMQIAEDDYPRLSKLHPQYTVFQICHQKPVAAHWVKLLPERRSINSLAYEIAAAHFGRTASTLETAWKDYKPRKKARRD
jgi:hypothetical protein